MLVHSCYVDDGAGNKVPLVDEKGWAIETQVIKYPSFFLAAVLSTDILFLRSSMTTF
jgi:hypothetical protein